MPRYHKIKNCVELSPVLLAVLIVTFTTQYCLQYSHKWPIPGNKLILTWYPYEHDSYFGFGKGTPEDFIAAGCNVTSCSIISDRKLMAPDRYDALLFYYPQTHQLYFGFPIVRSPNQLYVFTAFESQVDINLPRELRGFFNVTMTYRLDSDIPWPYLAVIDRRTNKTVAPNMQPPWDYEYFNYFTKEHERKINETLEGRIPRAVWVNSKCFTDSRRESYIRKLRQLRVPIDSYGRCAHQTCDGDIRDCMRKLSRKYYFFMIFEDSLCIDYIRDSVVIAMNGGAVPVILSGTNLVQFLPPDSYIDARHSKPEYLAAKLRYLLVDPSSYMKYLKWRVMYRVERRSVGARWPKGSHPMCSLCNMLHSKRKFATKRIQPDVYSWWKSTRDGYGPACFKPSHSFIEISPYQLVSHVPYY